MIEGVVNAVREAVVPLAVAGPAGRTLPIDAVIDTGFSGFLTLPAALVSELTPLRLIFQAGSLCTRRARPTRRRT